MSAIKRAIVSGVILLVLTGWARPAQAASIPFINVTAFGLELCEQSVCGAAIFVGIVARSSRTQPECARDIRSRYQPR